LSCWVTDTKATWCCSKTAMSLAKSSSERDKGNEARFRKTARGKFACKR
jgi:hypothetical protein